VSTLQLKVGGRYLNRAGEEVTIIRGDEARMFPFCCNEGRTYTEAGYWEGIDSPGDVDLVSELKEEVISQAPNYIVLPSSIILNVAGDTHSIHVDDSRYASILGMIKSGDWSGLVEVLEPAARIKGDGILYANGIVTIDGEAVPDALNDRLLAYADASLPYSSLVAFIRKLRLNPSFNARKQLFSFLTHNGHPLTESGNFIAYRGVRADFTDVHSGQFDQTIGTVNEMDRGEVDDNPNNTCSAGLHVACYSYANGFGSVTVEVEVNPADVVCVPTDYNGTKMRVCKYRVVGVSKGVRADLIAEDYSDGSDEESDDCDPWDDAR
jgi:hypothetical protein